MPGQAENSPRRLAAGIAGALCCLAALPAVAQYPGQISTKPKNVPPLRAVAVIEWTGTLKKPTASRVIPISVWDGTTLQDAGIYLARPAPLALQSETEYVLQKDGRDDGLFDVSEAANQGGTWIGFGEWKPLPTGPSPAELARERANREFAAEDAGDEDEPVLHRKYHPGDAQSAGGKTGKAANNAPAPDPDRPRLGGDTTSGSSTTADNNAPPPDPDRPRLKADDNSKPAKAPSSGAGQDMAHVTDLPNIADPDRPRLAYGKPADYQGPAVKPTVMGLPPDMHQQVGISDVRKIQNHPWDYSWANPADALKMKAALEQIARKAMGLDQPAAPAPASKSKRSSRTRKAAAPPPPPVPLEDEQFRVLELTYGSGATMVFSAHTKGAGAAEKFITLIAQPDLYGGVMVLYKNVTDADHLDLTPRMRLVDAVDAEGDNRGELLFELRGKIQREFALFRVVRGQATEIFVTSPLGQGRAVAAE
ncbi:MAG: hypothetical protein ACLGPM_03730 [Acidobacteriota bacterium]